MRLSVLFFSFFACTASTASTLPVCPDGDTSRWTNCQATYTSEGTSKYVGEFRDSKPHGQGTYYYLADNQYKGDKYVGEFKSGKLHGQGTYFHANGDKYVGEFRDSKPHGQGTYYVYKNGAEYVGEFRDGKHHGQGTYTFASGNKYVGEFREGKRHGQGIFTWSSGNNYVGEFRDGKRHGQGILSYSDGRPSEEGVFEDNKFVRSQRIPEHIAGRPSTPTAVATRADKEVARNGSQVLADSSKSLEGTIWRGTSSLGRDYQIEFLPKGVLRYSNWNGQKVATYENTRWLLSSNNLSLDFNNGFATWQGVVAGDNISGSAQNKNGQSFTWNFKRIDATSAPPFDQVVRKFIPGSQSSPPQGNPQSQGVTSATSSTSQIAQNTVPTVSQKSFEFIPRLTPEQINNSVIKAGFSQTDLDIFLSMYGFIWSINNFLSDTPDHREIRWSRDRIQRHQRMVQYKGNAQFTLNKYDETISTLAATVGLTSAQFKQAVGIIEVFVPPACPSCDPGYKTLKSKRGGLVTTALNRDDITSDGIGDGIRAFVDYVASPGTELKKNDKGHPGFELTPDAFFDFYSKWIPIYYLEPSRLSRFQAAANVAELRLEKQQFEAEQAAAKSQEEERKRQEFLNSPEGKRQIAKQQEEERQRQRRYAKEFPFYAVITCGENFPVHACFSSGRVKTELELRNGNEYKMYTLIDIMQIPKKGGGLSFDLRSKFQLTMQNADDRLILNLKIYNRTSNSIIFEKSAARFGVIKISN